MKETLYYPLRAISKDKTTYTDFTVKDGICAINDREFVLFFSRFTPILLRYPIYRGTEDGKFFEGDVITDSKDNLYVLRYNNGFYALNKNVKKQLEELDAPRTIATTILSDFGKYNSPNKIKFKYNDIILHVDNFLGGVEHGLIVNIYGWDLLQPENIQLHAMSLQDGRMLFYGDGYEDGVIVMNKGVVCKKVSNNIEPI